MPDRAEHLDLEKEKPLENKMRYKQIIESPYIQQLIQKIGTGRLKTGKPVPPNALPSGRVKSAQTSNVAQRVDKQLSRQLLKPGNKLPMPVSPNREQDFEIDRVDRDTVTLKNPKPKAGEPTSTTIKKQDLEPVVTNIMRRVRSQTQ